MRIEGFTPNEEIFSFGNVDKENTKETSNLFSSTFKNALDKINEMQVTSDEKTEAFVAGDDVEIHEVMLAAEEAKLSLQFAVEVRNKIVEAYQELNNMQL